MEWLCGSLLELSNIFATKNQRFGSIIIISKIPVLVNGDREVFAELLRTEIIQCMKYMALNFAAFFNSVALCQRCQERFLTFSTTRFIFALVLPRVLKFGLNNDIIEMTIWIALSNRICLI